jgi:hypothetical protein
MPEKSQRRPLLDPLLLTLKSRRFVTAAAALLVTLLIGQVPQLETLRSELTTVIVTLALGLIGGYSLEDAAVAVRRQAQPPELRALLREMLEALLQEQRDNPPSS